MSDMVAFLIVGGYACGLLAMNGVTGFFSDKQKALQANPFYAHSDFYAQHLAAPMFGYQMWNLAICFVLPDLRDPKMWAHHAVTILLAVFSVWPQSVRRVGEIQCCFAILCTCVDATLLFAPYRACTTLEAPLITIPSIMPFLPFLTRQYNHGFGFFFFGLVEISNLPLNCVDFFNLFDVPEGKAFYERTATANFVFQLVFAACFVGIRLVWWPIISFGFWVGSFQLLSTGLAHSSAIVVMFVACNLFMTCLQFYWGYEIFLIAVKVLGPKPAAIASDAGGANTASAATKTKKQ